MIAGSFPSSAISSGSQVDRTADLPNASFAAAVGAAGLPSSAARLAPASADFPPSPRPLTTSWRSALPQLGPGLLVAVGYVDPGNWATDVSGGAQFGYTPLSVILLASLMAMVAQALSVRVAITTGKSLAELCRDNFSPKVAACLWLLAEIALIATDLAELVGSAVALNLLFGLDVLPAMALVTLSTLLVLWRGGADWRLRVLITLLMATVASCLGALLVWADPSWTDVAAGLLPKPEMARNPDLVFIAVGIIGATMMPHNLYLHSGLIAPIASGLDVRARQAAIRTHVRNSNIALSGAFLVNAAILIAAGAVFHARGFTEVTDLGAAHALLTPLLGTALAATLFAVALLAAGQSSTVTATLAGQLVMEGFLRLRISPTARRVVVRLAALGPALVWFYIAGDTDSSRLLVLSQVILSLQLPFAVVPLVAFCSSRRLMGELALGPLSKALAWSVAGLVLGFNALMLWQMSA